MEVKAYAKSLRISPRKLRLVVDLVRGKKLAPALAQLQFSGRAAALPVTKLLKSALANAQHNYDLSEDNLLIKEIFVDGAATLKRSMPRAQGRAALIRKRTSHVTVVLGEVVDSGVKTGRKVALEKPVDLMAAADQATKTKSKDADETKDKSKDLTDTRRASAKRPGASNTKGFTGKLFQRKSGSSS